tara:strand:+ start:817 stop:2130 length:1314 start_codon:yes stop_codon:yes gene_type:complete
MTRKRNTPIEVTIQSVDPAGAGVADHEGRTVFVRGALPGERVNALVRKRYRGNWYSELRTITNPSDIRACPPCAHYKLCGACSYQHVKYADQILLKQHRLINELHSKGVRPKKIREPKFSNKLKYRRKARLGVRALDEETFVGFREAFGRKITRMQSCETLDHRISDLLPQLHSMISGLDLRARIPQVEIVAGDNVIALIVRHLEPFDSADLLKLKRFAQQSRLWLYLQAGGYDELCLVNSDADLPPLGYSLEEFGVWLGFSVTDFIQANGSLNKSLVSDVVKLVPLEKDSYVVDMFCGVGNFTIPLARAGHRVLGLELNSDTVARAYTNSLLNRVEDRCKFQQIDLYGSEQVNSKEAKVLLLDPPRSGAENILSSWVSSPDLQLIIYVSCNPVSFARDAALMEEGGFSLKEVGIYDMFPQTSHIETLGVFVRKANG